MGATAAPFVSDTQLTEADFQRLAARPGFDLFRARKIGFVAATRATAQQFVETRWNGCESSNTAEPGDWIATNLSAARQPLRDGDGNLNTYVIRADKFPALYEPLGTNSELGPVFKARASVRALRLPAGFDILAPWGERQTAPSGLLILNGDEVYGIATEPFEQTYEVVSD